MTKTGQIKLFMVVAAALALCLLVLVAAGPAEAAFPGKNGKIFFQSYRDGNPHIYSINPNGTGLSRLTFTSANTDPAVSPDGTKIAFISGSTTNTSYEVFVMNADGSGRRQVTNTSVAEQEPAWSSDGMRLVYASNSFDVDGETDLEIWTINADGTGRAQLTNNAFPDTQPAWSPLGDKIAFVSARTGDTDRNVYVMNANGAGQASITPNSPTGCSSNCYQGHDDAPAWSPDGSKIAYVHGYGPPDNPFAGGGVPNIWTMDPNGGNKVNVSNNPNTSSSQPAWSPDKTKIAYVDIASGTTNRDIHVMAANGQGLGALDTDAAHDINPDWQQDSIPPQTTITAGPSTITKGTSASFSFVSNETGSTFQCSLDGAAFSACASPKGYTGLKNGSHTFRVRAIDGAGNADATPAIRTWTVDTIKPTVSSVSPKHASITRDTTPTIKATVRDNRTNLAKSNIRLYVAGKAIPASKFSYNRATDQLVYNSPKLFKGKKAVRIVATDAAKNTGAKSWYFTIR